ncbi:MAG: type II toxin-antitoxin system HicA family toxin [Kiritimatiellae bacterium]|nr:type II toxin-antitoxin system HicA family toxin [Kiritimatiellia bacterium]
MKPLTAQQMAFMLNARGWLIVRQHGSHMVFKKNGEPKIVVVPDHGKRALSTGTQRRIMRDAGITPDEL